MRRFALNCDLKDHPDLIREYKQYHQKIWPEITRSIREKGITSMEIYLLGTRLFMIMDVQDDFSFDKAEDMDRRNPWVQQWEELMWKYQQSPPGAAVGEKWVLMDKIFDLEQNG